MHFVPLMQTGGLTMSMVLKWHFVLHSLKKMEKVATLKIQIISYKNSRFLVSLK